MGLLSTVQKALTKYNPVRAVAATKPVQKALAGNGALSRAVGYLYDNPNSPVGQQGYFNRQVIQPVATGLHNVKAQPGFLGKGQGVLDVLRGAYNASPLGMVQNAAIGSVASTGDAIRTGHGNAMQAINGNEQLSQGFGVKNKAAGAALDIGTNLVTANPRGVLAGVTNLENLGAKEGLVGNAKVLAKSAAQVVGLDHPTNTLKEDLSIVGKRIGKVLSPATDFANADNIAHAAKTYNAPIPDKSTWEVNGHKVTGPPEIRTITLPESQARDLLKTKALSDFRNVPVLHDYPSGEPQVQLHIDANTGKLVRWTADNPSVGAEFNQHVYANALNGPQTEARQVQVAAGNKEGGLPAKPNLSRVKFRTNETPTVETVRPTANEKLVDNGKNLNVNRLDVAPETKQALLEVADTTSLVKDAKGAPITRKEVVAQAQRLADQSNGAISRDEALTFQAKMTATRQRLAHAAESSGGKVTPDLRAALVEDAKTSKFLASALSNRAIEASPNSGEISAVEKYARELAKHGADIEEVLKQAEAQGVDFNDAKQAASFYRQFVNPKLGDWLDMVRYNSMLSSPNTHINNAFSNLLNSAVMRPLEKTVGGMTDFLSPTRTHFAGEGPAYVKGYFSAVHDASHRFADVMKGTAEQTNLDTRMNVPLAPGGGAAGAAESALSYPMRLLEASDQFFTKLVQEGETASLKYRESKGVAVGDIAKQAKANADYVLYRQGLHPSGQGTVLNTIDDFTQKLQDLRSSDNPLTATVAKFTVPFLKTPMNILKQGVEYSPLGVATQLGAADPTAQFAKAAIGSAIFAGSSMLLGSGRISWAAPATGTKERQAWDAAHMQAYSVRIGNTWVAFNKLPPGIAFPLAMTAALHDATANGKLSNSTFDQVMTAIASYGGFLSDQSYAQGIGNILSAAKGGPDAWTKIVSGDVQQLIPYRALGGWLARLSDGTQRTTTAGASQVEKQVQLLMQQIPGLSQKTPAKLDQNGNPIPNGNRVISAFSPVRISTVSQPGMQDYQQFKANQYNNQVATLQKDSLKSGKPNPQPAAGNLPSGVRQLSDGTFAYKKSDGTVATAPTADKASISLAKDRLAVSPNSIATVGDTVLRKNSDGSVSTIPRASYETQLNSATLASQKASGDLSGWLETASKQYVTLQAKLQDPTLDPLEAQAVQNSIATLVSQAQKYRSYGGFTKGKAAKKPKALKVGKSLSSGISAKAPGAKVTTFKSPSVKVRKLKVASTVPKASKPKAVKISATKI